jgi:prevent-host-death family protein
MDTVGVRELRQYATQVLRRVRQGEVVGVTDRGVLVAQIVPVPEDAWLAAEHAGTVVSPRHSGNVCDIPTPVPGPGPSASEILSGLRDTER